MKIKSPIQRLMRSRFDLSRRQFKYFQPSPATRDVNDSQITTSSTSLRMNNNNNNNHGSGDNNVQDDIRYSTQFRWTKREVIDENSVYRRRPKSMIEFNRLNGYDTKEAKDDDFDDSTIASSVKYYLIQPTDDVNSSLNNRMVNANGGGSSIEGSFAPSVINTESLSQQHELDSAAFIAPLIDGFESTDAVRSNYVSEYSTKQDERTIPLKFARYRKAKKLSQYRVKGGFHLESRKGQMHRELMQKELMLKEKKLRDDALFINALQ